MGMFDTGYPGFSGPSYAPNRTNWSPPLAANSSEQYPSNNPLMSQYKLYNTAVEQQSGDYGNIMQAYKDLLKPGSSISNLNELSRTGGYSPEDIANIRERGISPIRSVYAGANRDVDRQRALQGGYSPNYAAVKAKMARELSDTVANHTTNINADLAQRIAQNKLSIAPSAASSSMEPIRGMASLYGSTPGLASLYGNQALQGAQLQNQINQQGNQYGLDLISRFYQ